MRHPPHRVAYVLVLVALLALSGCSVFGIGSGQGPTGMPVGQPASDTWTTYGGNLYNQRYSSLNQINASNVKNLKGAWTFHTGISSAGTSFESSPVVVNGTMYVTGPIARSGR